MQHFTWNIGETFLSFTLAFSVSKMSCIIPCPKKGHFHYIKKKKKTNQTTNKQQNKQRKEKYVVCCLMLQMRLQATKNSWGFHPLRTCLLLSTHFSIDLDCTSIQVLARNSRKWGGEIVLMSSGISPLAVGFSLTTLLPWQLCWVWRADGFSPHL